MRLASAFILEQPDKQSEYLNSVHTIVSDVIKKPIPNWMTAMASLMIDHENFAIFKSNFASQIPNLRNDEIKWIISFILSKDQFPDPFLTELAINKSVFGQSGNIFLQQLLIEDPLPEGMLASLGRFLEGQVTLNDIQQLGAWIHPQALVILKGILLIPQLPAELSSEAIDYIAGKESQDSLTISFIKWLQSARWQKRDTYSLLLGIITSSIDFEEQTLLKATNCLRPFESENSIFSILLGSNNQSFIQYYLKNFKEKIPASAMISLLSNPSADIRVMAIKALKNQNNTTILQLIKESYKSESDPMVKKVYEDELWIINQKRN